MSKRRDPLIGCEVTVKADALDRSGDPHHLAGQVGVVVEHSRGDNYKVAIGDQVTVLPKESFTINVPDTGTDRFELLDLNLIEPSPTNPRKHFDEAKLAELVESIRASGVLQPILVRPLPAARLAETSDRRTRPAYELVAGERRWRASFGAERPTIPALIRPLTDAQALEFQIVENLQRDDLTELEEAEGYQRLCDETGIAKEDIGAKIGRSRSYVYARMKLLALSNAGRQALRSGEIDASKALLIARIPDERLQQKALEEAMRKDYDGESVSERQFKRWLQMNVMLRLEQARFDIADASLCPDAGACGTCSKRTGANPDLFGDVDGPDVCIDPPCFHAKEAALSERLVEQARAKGMNVIEGKEALELKPKHFNSIKGYVPLDDEIRKALPERELKKSVVMFVDPHDQEAVEVVPQALAQKAYAKTNPQSKKARQEDMEWQAECDRIDLELEYQKRWRVVAVEQIKPRVAEITQLSPSLARRVMFELSGADQRCDEGDAGEALGLKEDFDGELLASTIRATTAAEALPSLVTMLLYSDRTARSTWMDSKRSVDPSAPVIEELAGVFGIDLEAIKATVQTQIRDERATKDAPAEAPKPKAKGKGKTTKADATAAIAAAMAQAENPNAFAVGQLVRVKVDLRNGKDVLHTSGLDAEIVGKQGDRAWRVIPDGMSIEVFADYTELEPAGVDVEEDDGKAADDRYDDAKALVIEEGRASISTIQRHLKVGYNRAAQLLESLVADGLVEAVKGGGWRVVGATA